MIRCLLAALLCLPALTGLALPGGKSAKEEIADPVFDFTAIFNDSLDARVLKSTEANGIVTEEVEYTAEILGGKPVRIFGILAYPQGGRKLPAIFWSQGGMYQASAYWPQTWAAKGYFCMNVTLPHDVYNSFTRFTTERPEDGNLAHLAVAQMRGITYITSRPEVDVTRIGVGGSSYGGFFASLIAGADPRIKAGISFFTSGNHLLGTGYPQFLQLRTTDEVGIWMGTIDPAWRLKRKAVPFLWAVASNDHWHHLPAAVQTCRYSIGEKRLSIAPNWYHALPENVDTMLIDWFDVYLLKTRKPYNAPGMMKVTALNGRLAARWTWSGDNPVRKAELVVAYGRTRPWHDGWLYRYHYVIPAALNGSAATAAIPLPERGLEMLVYGNITDDRGVLTSTVPVTVKPDELGATVVSPLALNTALVNDFSPEEMVFVQRHGESLPGEPDAAEKQAGAQSLRVPAGKALTLKLGHIPGHSHKLCFWMKGTAPATIAVRVTAQPPAGWQFRIVDILRREQPDSPKIAYEEIKPPVYSGEFAVDATWRQFTLECPDDGTPIEGYTLTIAPAPAGYWLDTIVFSPVWKNP